MLSQAKKIQLERIAESMKLGGLLDCIDMTHEEVLFYVNELDKLCAKSKKKEEVMNKYLLFTEEGLARYCESLEETKSEATKAIESGCKEVFVYEKKFVASVVKPKVEFKEI